MNWKGKASTIIGISFPVAFNVGVLRRGRELMYNYDYKGITRFYYYKICDSIVDFGIKNIEFAD